MGENSNRSRSRPEPETGDTIKLLRRARSGDDRARSRLIARYYPVLLRYAHGRLPARARGLADTGDLVQVTVMRALKHLDTFDHRGTGSLLAFLRQILVNQIRDELRKAARRPGQEDLSDEIPDPGRNPLEELIERETVEIYEAALGRLSPEQQEAIALRVEMGCSYQEVAEAMGGPSANAARMVVHRALAKLGPEMRSLMGGSRAEEATASAALVAAARSKSVRLFLERARRSQPGFKLGARNVRSVVEICRRFRHLPVAIELIAGRMDVEEPEEVLSQLDGLLRGAEGIERTRDEALGAVARWSYERLSDEERRLVCALSAGGPEAGAAFAGMDPSAVERTMVRLAARAFVRVEGPAGTARYRIREELAEIAARWLDEGGDSGRVEG